MRVLSKTTAAEHGMSQSNNRGIQLQNGCTHYDVERQELYNYEKKEISLFNAQLPVIRDFQLKIHDQ